ncbi:1-aminocyclopropane-1-carboxylate deaminase [Rasamsonia emersonii CBS 393.64]|uniref:1-aminocyclopropane-1-carboxylate deaminase n=1 Tax=Rasamsonia emersonii (strain ATCC 16479 / CBS 393.64 / IMI 116815) TaxID=1408163 RepID=A0A0F4YXT0_RASE3|nr:1-aminocyclopropane-1-carboxylate deaminase [Rasamsonia emersonii CBS 393.64]KKA23054.1 1-aminocyclopropane-1-carboxylate deaminase [Rasamsonia emersonii CBS 393.64]
MLSSRGTRCAAISDIPWRYALRQSYNKDTNPDGLISFALAENIPMRKEIVKYINEKVTFTEDSVSYGPKPATTPRLLAALVAHLQRNFHPVTPVDPQNILIANNPTSLGSMLGITLAEPGDGILVSRPMYGRFELDYGLEAGVNIVYADTDPEEAFSSAVVDKYEIALKEAERRGQKIRAVLLVNPNNPVGRCYPVETLKAILRFCKQHQIHLISDEVYGMCGFDSGSPDAVPFTSILSIDLSGLIDPNLVHMLYGFSKDFASGGLHLGFLISQNKKLLQACTALLSVAPSIVLHKNVQKKVTRLCTDLMADGLIEDSTRLAASYRLVTSILDREGIRYVKGGNAGFFIYIDLSPYLPSSYSEEEEPLSTTTSTSSRQPTDQQATKAEFALAQRLLDAGVFLHPGEEHGPKRGWFRLVFSQEEDVLRKGLNRMIKALKG